MNKFINISGLMGYLFDDEKLAKQASKIIQAILEAQSPRLMSLTVLIYTRHDRLNVYQA